MGYYPPNMGGQYPQGYPGGQVGMGSYPGGMSSPMMGRGGRQGMGQYTPNQGGFPGQMPMGQMPMGQPMGQMPMQQPQMPMGQMPQQQMGSGGGSRLFKKGGQGMPGGAPMGGMQQPQQMPGMQMPGMAQQQMGGKRPGLMSRMANQQQQAYPQAGAQGYAPTYNAQPYYPQAPGRGARVPRMGGMGGMQQAPQQLAPMPQMPPQQAVSSITGKPLKPKQFNLKTGPAGVGGSGIAKINGPNSFSLIANELPDPESIAANYPDLGPNPVYVAYLTNRKGRDSFTVGQLMPVGAGTYRGAFQSNVPFYEQEQVVVTLENPYNIQNTPTGPVVLTSGGGAGLIAIPKPVKRFFGGVWERVKGVGKGIGKKKEEPPQFTPVPEMPGVPPLPEPQSFLNNYSLGPMGPAPTASTPTQPMNVELPGLGPAMEDPSKGGNP